MYKTQAETRAFFAAFKPLVAGVDACEIIVAPPFTALAAAVEAVSGSHIWIAAQDMYWASEGAFTGEVSAPMLVEAGCRGGDHRALRAAAVFRRDQRDGQSQSEGGAGGGADADSLRGRIAGGARRGHTTRCWNGNSAARWLR